MVLYSILPFTAKERTATGRVAAKSLLRGACLRQVLLSLGVSYTNELDQGRALNFLTAWLSRQPAFTKVLLFCLSHML